MSRKSPVLHPLVKFTEEYSRPSVAFIYEDNYPKRDKVKIGGAVVRSTEDQQVVITKENGAPYAILVRTSLVLTPYDMDEDQHIAEGQYEDPLRNYAYDIERSISGGRVYRAMSTHRKIGEAEVEAQTLAERYAGKEDPFEIVLDTNVEDLVDAALAAHAETANNYSWRINEKARAYVQQAVKRSGSARADDLEEYVLGHLGYSVRYVGEKRAVESTQVVLRHKGTMVLRETLLPIVQALPGTEIGDEVVQQETTLLGFYERRRKIDICTTLRALVNARQAVDKAYAAVASVTKSEQERFALGNGAHLNDGALTRYAAQAETAFATYEALRREAYGILPTDVIETIGRGEVADSLTYRDGDITVRTLTERLVPDADSL